MKFFQRLRLPGQSPAARILALSAILLVLFLAGRWLYTGVRQAAQTTAYLRIGGPTPKYEPTANATEAQNAHLSWLQNTIAGQRDPWTEKTAARLVTVISHPPVTTLRLLERAARQDAENGPDITMREVMTEHAWAQTALIVASRLGRREPVTPEARRMLEEALLELLEHDYWKVREIGLVAIFDAELLTDQKVRAKVEAMAREDPSRFIRDAAQGWLFNHDERMARRRAGEETPVWKLREEYGFE